MKLSALVASLLMMMSPAPGLTAQTDVVNRTAKAINYQYRDGTTKADLRGTPLQPDSRGEAKVVSRDGSLDVDIEFRKLKAANRFGPEIMTYVLWAISPEGRVTNLGEILLNGTSSKLKVTTNLRAFALIVTAEPYFGVSRPSDLVVMESVVRANMRGKVEVMDASYELIPRAQYAFNALSTVLTPMVVDGKTPLDLHEARNAVRIARWSGADVYAADSFQNASDLLAEAENATMNPSGSRSIAETSREAVQAAEEARSIALKVQANNRLAQERENSAIRNAAGNAAAAKGLKDASDAELRRRAAEAHTDRDRLILQLNAILQTEDSERGLVVNLPDVLFEAGQYSLTPVAQEKLSKISNIILASPTLKLGLEGHGEGVGTNRLNLSLSQERANSVRDFLASQGIVAASISSTEFGGAIAQLQTIRRPVGSRIAGWNWSFPEYPLTGNRLVQN